MEIGNLLKKGFNLAKHVAISKTEKFDSLLRFFERRIF